MEQSIRLCPCTKRCKRHGDCNECRSYHSKKSEKHQCKCDKLGFPELYLTKVALSDIDAFIRLYTSLHGIKGCTWNDDYPDIAITSNDIECNRLFPVIDKTGALTATVCMELDPEITELSIWSERIKKPFVVSRLGVKRELQGMGIAKALLNYSLSEMKKDGYDAALILVNSENATALALYTALGFSFRGNATLFEQPWLCYEALL